MISEWGPDYTTEDTTGRVSPTSRSVVRRQLLASPAFNATCLITVRKHFPQRLQRDGAVLGGKTYAYRLEVFKPHWVANNDWALDGLIRQFDERFARLDVYGTGELAHTAR